MFQAAGDSSSSLPSPQDMKVSEIKAELDSMKISHHGLFEKQELVARLLESRAQQADITELRANFLADLQSADMPDELKKTFTEMAADDAMLREMSADVNLLQDVGEDPGSFKKQMDQAGGLAGKEKKTVREMKVSEIKAELDMRGISYEGLYEKRELVQKLEQARKQGIADPSIVDKFNERMLESKVDPDFKSALDNMANDPEMYDNLKAADGSLPGGMNPEKMKKLFSNPELMIMLQTPKVQELMKAVMGGGPESLQKYASDPEAMAMLQKINGLLEEE